jgi:hypothetical protein
MALYTHYIHIILLLLVCKVWFVVRPINLGMNLTNRGWHIAWKLLLIGSLLWVVIVLSSWSTISNLRQILTPIIILIAIVSSNHIAIEIILDEPVIEDLTLVSLLVSGCASITHADPLRHSC